MVIAQAAQVVQLADGSHHSADVFLIHRDARCLLKLGNAPSDQLLATHVHFLNVAVGLLNELGYEGELFLLFEEGNGGL